MHNLWPIIPPVEVIQFEKKKNSTKFVPDSDYWPGIL